MAKKPRSQRRKKGGSNIEKIDTNSKEDNVETLSDSYTVADSFSVATDFEDLFPEDPAADDYLDADGNNFSDLESAAAAAALRQQKLNDALSNIGELPSEKRSSNREGLLRRTFRAITHWATGTTGSELVEHYEETISLACFYSLRAGNPAEQYAACRVLEATSVVLGGDHDDYYEKIYEKLIRIIMTTSGKGRAVPVRVAALRSLAMANFICSTDPSSTEELLNLCESVADVMYRNETTPLNLRATALDCWALLCTTISESDLAASYDEDNEDEDDDNQSDFGGSVDGSTDGNKQRRDDIKTMGRGLGLIRLLKECLDSNSVELRSAAGECIALIHEARLKIGIEEEDEENEENDDNAHNTTTSSRRSYHHHDSWNGSEWEILMEDIEGRIQELSVESGYKLSKKMKKAQRATFREILSTVVEDELPTEVVQFRGGTMTLHSWREIVQLNFVRHCLQGGFQMQLLFNETLQIIFGADGTALNALGNMSSLEKRLIMSKASEASKQADMKMTKNRRVRNNVKNHFLTVDGEDI